MELSATQLNDALLVTEPPEAASEPKRNSKDGLINKIIQVCEENHLELPESNSKLRRMTKQQLAELLAQKIEISVKHQMAEQVGVKPGADNSVIALGALRMVHDIAAGSAEKMANIVLKPRGYEIVGFQRSLKEPHVRESIDQVLAEIAEESNVLQYFESPYTRLALCWGSALVSSIQRCENIEPMGKQNAADLGPRTAREQAPRECRPDWRPKNGQERGDSRPPEEVVKSV